MSGHSKWHKIKHQKQANDKKRGKIFTKLGKSIALAAREGGGDPEMNFSLRLEIEKAKEANMPNENIERAIKRGTGELDGGEISRVSYEAYGPNSSAMIIDCTTDNKNRTIAEVRNIVEGGGGNFAKSGSVSWQFQPKGSIIIKPAKLEESEKYGKDDTYKDVDPEEAMMELMEIEGLEDIQITKYENEEGEEVEVIEVVTTKNDFAEVDKNVRDLDFKVLNSELIKVPDNPRDYEEGEEEKIMRLVEKIEEHDDVENVWTNIKD
jgi:YebC/PmpR family DNA-binding regulatory protein